MPLAIVYCYSESSANLDFVFDCTRRAGFDLNSPVVISMDRGKAGIASVQRLAHAMPRFCIQHIIRNIQKEQGNKLPLGYATFGRDTNNSAESEFSRLLGPRCIRADPVSTLNSATEVWTVTPKSPWL